MIKDANQQLKTRISSVFDRTAATYDRLGPRFFSEFGRRLIQMAEIQPGSRVLDVATGRGALLFPAAAAAGVYGRAVGIDLSPEMAARTRLDAECMGLKNVTVECMDAEHLTFKDDSFNHVLCGFSLFFFPALEKALSEFKRVLKPGGRLAVSIWGPGDERWRWLGDLYEKYQQHFVGDPNIMPVHFHEPEILETQLERAGFEEIQTILVSLDFIYADEDEWWNVQWSHVNRAVLESLDPAVLADYKKDLFQYLHTLREPDGIHQQFSAIYALASKAMGRLAGQLEA